MILQWEYFLLTKTRKPRASGDDPAFFTAQNSAVS